jgi:hypothetical protein
VTLPTNWVSTGENLGPGAGSDGNVSSKLAVALVNINISDANFGIEQLSIADNKTYSGLNSNDFNKPSGNASYPFILRLDNLSGTADGDFTGYSTATNPGKLSGADPEDGNYGGATGSSNSRVLVITNLPDSSNDALVYYNGTTPIILVPNPSSTDSSYKYWNAAANYYQIPDFHPSNLAVFMRKNGHMAFSFTYGWLDSANLLGALATYSVSAYSPLPVTWLGFEAKWEGNDAILNWSTAQETDNKYFEVQRSTNGKDFEYLYTIEASEAQGVNYYQYIDTNALKQHSSTLYYRIKQTDWNGESSYSIVKSLAKRNNVNTTTYSVYPNPFITNYNIVIGTSDDKTILCNIQSIEGKIVFTNKYNLRKGSNLLNITEMESLPAGMYIITISDGKESEILKITKVNNY